MEAINELCGKFSSYDLAVKLEEKYSKILQNLS